MIAYKGRREFYSPPYLEAGTESASSEIKLVISGRLFPPLFLREVAQPLSARGYRPYERFAPKVWAFLPLKPLRELTMRDLNQLWKEMISKSFSPTQWYVQDDDDVLDGTLPSHEETFMWVYRRIETDCYTVGFYDPKGEWHTDSDHLTNDAAAERVAYLNGGRTRIKPTSVHDAVRSGFYGEDVKG